MAVWQRFSEFQVKQSLSCPAAASSIPQFVSELEIYMDAR